MMDCIQRSLEHIDSMQSCMGNETSFSMEVQDFLQRKIKTADEL
ncbi:hypothetical protein BSM4216_0595 [Bacillus smithii]|nr:hypothetical protein BSM4216_0595 [Bacillus smithii]